MYGGLVIPIRIIQPSGIIATKRQRSSGKFVSMSNPYAPVSSLVNHNSTAPSSNDSIALFTISSKNIYCHETSDNQYFEVIELPGG